MKCEQHKVRKSKLSEDVIRKIADQLKQRYFSLSEIEKMTHAYGYKGSKEIIFSLFEVRGYMIAEKTVKILQYKKKKGTYGDRVLYKIVTAEDYEKYEMEATKDAKRRLLATVSC
ncbi:MAG: hypothetical protein J6S67_12445 [Methanobrevibacter sp.]|nr:hypothetical protein [Methanobrevibacter sp.]